MRRTLKAVAVVGICGVSLFGFASARAEEERPEPSGQTTTCQDVLETKPGHEVDQSTDPSDGADVRAGDGISVRMVWDAEDFTDAPLYDVLSCVTVGGVLDETLGVHAQDPPNSGEFAHRLTVPASLPSGTELCVSGAVAGDGNGYFERNVTTDDCFTSVGSPAESSPLVETPPAPPPADEAVVQGISITDERQGQATGPLVQDTLPRTGPRHQLPLALAGALMAVGGALVTIRPVNRRG